MRILVLQIARLGDVIQTSPLVRALRIKHPDAHIAMMVRGMGKAAAAHIPDVDEILLYDEDDLYADLRAEDSDRLLRAYRRTEEYVETLQRGTFDVVYNCTHSMTSAMLLQLAGIPRVQGAHLGPDGRFMLRGAWTTYFFASAFHRDYNGVNLCDTFAGLAEDCPPAQELIFTPTKEERTAALALLARHRIEPDAELVAFQLGASEVSKRWPPERFAALARLLSAESRRRVVLLGVKEEAALGEAFERAAPQLGIPLFGQTSVGEAAAVLERARVLVTNDTGTMHLAAAVKCPVVLASVGWVHFRETGPYGVGHYAIEKEKHLLGEVQTEDRPPSDEELLDPAHVAAVVERVLRGDAQDGHDDLPFLGETTEVSVHRSAFAPDGALEWYPVGRPSMTERDFLRMAYREMWMEHLSVMPRDPGRAGRGQLLAHYAALDSETVATWRMQAAEAFERLSQLALSGMERTDTLLALLRRKDSMRRAKDIVTELMGIDEEIRIAGEVHPCTKPLAVMGRFERDNLEGAEPLALAEATLGIYRDLHRRAQLMRESVEAIAAAIDTN